MPLVLPTARWRRRGLCRAWLLWLLVVQAMASSVAHAEALRVGVVTDGPWRRYDAIVEKLAFEVDQLIGPQRLRLDPEAVLHGDWTYPSAIEAVDTVLKDPRVDVVVALGLGTSTYLGTLGALPKPVIAPVAFDARVQGLPVRAGTSGVRNFSYLVLPLGFDSLLRVFLRVVPVSRVVLLTGDSLVQALPRLEERMAKQAEELGVELTVVATNASADVLMEKIPKDTQGVYLAPLPHLSDAQQRQLIEGLNQRKLPTFAHFGDEDVPRGALSGFLQSANIERIARRVAIYLERILAGEDPGTLPVGLRAGEPRLAINKETARRIGFSPSWEVLSEAELVNAEIRDPDAARSWTLTSAMQRARGSNLSLLAAARSVAATDAERGEALALLLPNLQGSVSGRRIDQDRAAAGFGAQPESTAQFAAQLTQPLFVERAWAGLSVRRRLLTAEKQRLEEVALDILEAAAARYLGVLQAKALERIRRQRVRVSRTNLELARLRESVGVADASETYRWESELAANQAAVIKASAQRNQAEIALNQLLNRPLEEPFSTEATIVDSGAAVAARELFATLDNPAALRRFRDVMVARAEAHSPELKRLDAAIAAQERLVASTSRRLWLPEIGLQADFSRRFWEDGAGVNPPSLPLPAGAGFPAAGRNAWSVGVRATLPLFEGGAGRHAHVRAQQVRTRLVLERDNVRNLVDQRVRSAVHRSGASHAGIALATRARGAAEQTLALVTDAYSTGSVSVLRLLDAQDAAFAAKQNEAVALFAFLVDVAALQRAAGEFTLFGDAAQRSALAEAVRGGTESSP